MFGYRVPAPDEAMLISGGRRGLEGRAVPSGDGARKVRAPCLRKTRFLTLSMCEAEVTETCVTRRGASRARPRRDRVEEFGNDHESIINAGQRFLCCRSDRDAVQPQDLRRSSARHHRLDDRRGDRHRAAEARRRGPGHLEGRDGQDRPDRGLVADPVDRRRRRRLHRGHVRTAQGGHPAPGPDRAGPGHPGVRRGGTGGRAQPGRVRPADRGRQGGVLGRGGPRAGAGRPGRSRWRRRTPSRRCSPRRPNWPSGRPSCVSSSSSPRWSSPPRPRRSGSRCSPSPRRNA